ncbi:saccharopine dehydrogenase NADP-binding domain-containing protein [candidate division TA06 bacterium]|nr:saccharopine dehydrogenase NADP-binding domain-containing protein [candidate division TA06 bacterium]
MKKIVVLGAGMMGSVIAVDLCHEYHVTVADVDPDQLDSLEEHHPIHTVESDLSNSEAVRDVILDADLVIGALPGFMGFEMLKTVINSGKNIVDISFLPEDPFELDSLAKQKQVTAVVDCGVAPGMCNLILGYYNQKMEVEYYECLVGGLPVDRSGPFQYKAPFSPIDVIEEYTRPARIMENGRVVTKPALSDVESVEIDPVGPLESFNTDGLRTLLKTMKIPNMKEKTLRYPGHIEYIRVLRESGFFDKEPINIRGTAVRPIDVTAKLLFQSWKLDKDESEFTVMRIIIRGKEQGNPKQYVYRLFDRFDEQMKVSSMARTTGYTCSAAARLVLEGNFTQKGICPPEFIGADSECFKKMIAALKKRKINYIKEEITL